MLTIRFPGPVSFLGSAEEQEKFVTTVAGPEWFPFKGSNDVGPSAIGFQGWLEKPAGKHGGVRMKGSRFVFEDGTPVKFWGTNLSYRDGAPEKPNADLTAARFAKWGVNAVRLHKPFGPGWEGIGDEIDGTKLTAKGLDQMDYFMAKLKQHGVYYGLSHTYGYRIRPGNRERYLAYDEIKTGLGGNTYGLINFAEDVQDLLIESVIGALRHKNPYTAQTWAEDPALAYIELHNEDDIFFYTTENVLTKCPTYRKDLVRRFAQWLKAKYGTQADLAKAWRGRSSRARRSTRKTSPSKETRGSAATACRRRPAARGCGSWTTPPFSMPCRTSSMASSSRRSARRATRDRCAGRRGRPRPWCPTITTCGPITSWAGSTGTTISVAG